MSHECLCVLRKFFFFFFFFLLFYRILFQTQNLWDRHKQKEQNKTPIGWYPAIKIIPFTRKPRKEYL